MIERKPWTRAELILAINLYCKTPFGKIHVRNPDIIELASKLERTSGSVSYKLANFASIDPSLDRKGASNVSKLDKEVWAEFFDNWDDMAYQSEAQMAKLNKKSLKDLESFAEEDVFEEGQSRESIVKVRIKQEFFRKMILSAYDNTCCITGISISELLIASHIVPWSTDTKNRLNPRNGLCLNALHDRAFDKGLISISGDLRIVVSPLIYQQESKRHNLEFITDYVNKEIRLPSRFLPDQNLLEYHRQNIFRG
ncbi:MAG: HNH endonuclease [Syntrophales bacterium]|jgi:putative restriction endonuclease|nr:HNH endonuclease [Syntrophales bacterium]MCK9390478.1 HNH endonuclease [Syntrophales bacterium]